MSYLNDSPEWREEMIEHHHKLQSEATNLRLMLQRAVNIMAFHAQRCPMKINKNFSGMEEHLSEYRAVMKEGGALVAGDVNTDRKENG